MQSLQTERNFFSKQELRDAVISGDPPVKVQATSTLNDGIYVVRGPHGNEPSNSWYATVAVQDCVVIKVLR